MASPTQWTWVWVNSSSWWWTGRPGMLEFMGSQRVGHDWATELNWTESEFCHHQNWSKILIWTCHCFRFPICYRKKLGYSSQLVVFFVIQSISVFLDFLGYCYHLPSFFIQYWFMPINSIHQSHLVFHVCFFLLLTLPWLVFLPFPALPVQFLFLL